MLFLLLLKAKLVTFSKLTNKEQKQIIKKEYPEWEVMIGSEKRNLSDSELLNRDYYRGRFATPRKKSNNGLNMIFNWEEIEF